jgi:hypothetical protein
MRRNKGLHTRSLFGGNLANVQVKTAVGKGPQQLRRQSLNECSQSLSRSGHSLKVMKSLTSGLIPSQLDLCPTATPKGEVDYEHPSQGFQGLLVGSELGTQSVARSNRDGTLSSNVSDHSGVLVPNVKVGGDESGNRPTAFAPTHGAFNSITGQGFST